MHHPAKFREDRSNRSGYMADFRFLRWRPCAVLNFQKLESLTSGPPRRANMRHRNAQKLAAFHKCKSYLLCLEFADKILIFAVLERRLLKLRETEASFCYYNFCAFIR